MQIKTIKDLVTWTIAVDCAEFALVWRAFRTFSVSNIKVDAFPFRISVEELECLATWKEGSSRYLVGRLHHGHASSNEDRYRCFVYEKAGQTVQGNLNNRAAIGMGTMDHEVVLPGGPVPEGTAEVYRVAQSGDATCNGLFSPMEGSRTMTLRKSEFRSYTFFFLTRLSFYLLSVWLYCRAAFTS